MLSAFLIVGMILRAKLGFLQKMFLPASVVGGFVGLILGPIILKDMAVIPIPDDWLSIYALLPGILIVPVVATVPFGVKFRRVFGKNKAITNGAEVPKKDRHLTRNMTILFAILVIVSQGQMTLGVGFHYLFNLLGMSKDFYPTFGVEIGSGFAGGHGTAGVVGSLLQSMNQPYWELAQGVTVTTATVGIVGGILIGIVLINFAARKGYTNMISDPSNFPANMLKGIESNAKEQKAFGKETTLSTSIDVLAFHVAVVIGGSGLSYAVLQIIKYLEIPILENIPIWAYAIIVMYFVWWVMCQLGLDWIISDQIMAKIASMFTEFAVVAAIVSMPIQAVMTYAVPLVIMMTFIFAFTVATAYFLCKKYYKDLWFERSVAVLGTCSGVFITGLLLLKMVDPEFKSSVLTEYSISYSGNSIVGFVMFPFLFSFLINLGVLPGFFLGAGVVTLAIILLLVTSKITSGNNKTVQDGGS